MHSLVATYPNLFHAVGNPELTFAGLTGIAAANSMYHFSQFVSCYHFDYHMHDITLKEEEEEHVPFKQIKMSHLILGLIKNATIKWDSIDVNLSKFRMLWTDHSCK